MKFPNYVFIFMLIVLSLATCQLTAQNKPNTPKDGFEIALSPQKVELNAGETQTITAELIRSKRFSKTTIELTASTSTEALEIKVVPSTEQKDLYNITVYANPSLAEGNYTFTLMGKSSFLRKGKLIDIIVKDKAQGTDKENK